MKRSPMPRRRKPMRRTAIRSAFPASNPVLIEGQRQARVRSGGRCEADIVGWCMKWATVFHHVVLRSAGGADTADNLLHICRPCHDYIHANPAAARALGLYGHRTEDGGLETVRANSTVTDAT